MGTVPRHRFVAARTSTSPTATIPSTSARPDDLAALHRRVHDRGAGPRSRAIACSRSAPGPAIRPRCSASSPRRSIRLRSCRRYATAAAALLEELGYTNVHLRSGDGYSGWPEEAPFDAIIVTAAPDHLPQPLVDQLAVGGRIVVPVGRGDQDSHLHEDKDLRERAACPCGSCR